MSLMLGKTKVEKKKEKQKKSSNGIFSILFDSIGNKIKTIAVLLLILGSVFCLIYSIYLLINGLFLISLFSLLGIIGVYIASCFIYGFGEIIENTNRIEKNTKKEN